MRLAKPKIFRNRKDAPAPTETIEAFHNALRELFFIEHPRLHKETPETAKPLAEFIKRYKDQDIWIYYPWNKKLIHSLPEDLYFKLRTARNRNIITAQEQINYRNTKVGIAGLSVGSAILSALVISGGPKILKIADFDIVEVSNLNRIKATLSDVGVQKTDVAAKNVWEIDPFAELYIWDSGLHQDNVEEFIVGKPRLDVFVDEMDSIALKITLRIICREHKTPVLMVTDNGDSIILDVERFDQEPKRPLLHGRMEGTDLGELKSNNLQKWIQTARKIIGPEYLGTRMQESIFQIKKTLSAVPQLGTTASLGGSAIAYAIRRIANNQGMPSGRYLISLEENFATPR